MATPTLQELATELNDIYQANGVGNTPLFNIIQNASSPTVQMKLHDLQGLKRLYQRLFAYLGGLSPKTACGSQLDTVAAFMGRSRKIEFKSVVPVVFCGTSCENCDVIAAGTIFLDNAGNQWETVNQAQITDGYGFVNAASVENGSFDLGNGELYLESPIDGLVLATNAASPDLGGGTQDDQSFRRSLLNIRPHWRVKETTDAVISALNDITGVVRAELTKNPDTCCPMFTVLGGSDEDVAIAIYDNAPISINNLCGSSSYQLQNCVNVPFQRFCPAIIGLRLTKDCQCKNQTEAEAIDAIFAKSQTLALNSTTIGPKEILCCQSHFNRVEFNIITPPLSVCQDDSDLITDPASGDQIYFSTVEGGCDSLCGTAACSSEFSSSAELCSYQYPILSRDHVEIVSDCPSCRGC